MADSDDTTTSFSVTRRMLLTSTMATAAIRPLEYGTGAQEAMFSNAACDPAIALWHAWKAACITAADLCKKQQTLETQLVDTVGFPHAEVYLPNEDVTVTLWWEGDIGNYFRRNSDFANIQVQAKADLAAHQARWDAEDKRIGYSAAVQAERIAAERERKLMEALMATPATTLTGVVGKLDAVLRENECFGECAEFTWRMVHSAFDDIVRMRGMGTRHETHPFRTHGFQS
jgi:hypothetical protein